MADFEPNSRYFKHATAKLAVETEAGQTRTVRYLRRRFIPPPGTSTTLVEHTVLQGERLDNITARYLGDPVQFWRVCDANNVLHPDDLTDEAGEVIEIGLPTI